VKITIFGLTLSSSWGNGHATPYRAIIRALSSMGHQVTFFEKDVPYYAKRRDFNTCDFCNLVLYSDWEEVRNRALRAAADSDVVITASYLSDGAQITDEILDLPRPLHVFYDLDTPITLKQLQNGNLDYLRRDQIPEFDLYLSFTGGSVLDELRTQWRARAVAPIYGCVDPHVHFRVEVPDVYRCALSYMGTYAADRKQKLDELFFAPACELPQEKFVLAGSLYPAQMQLPANMKHFEHVGPGDHAALYSSSRLTLNITRAEMAARGYCPSGRLFEAAACGTPLLSDNWQGLNEFFVDGEEILLVNHTADVLAAMKMNDEELARIAPRARERTLDEHTGARRAQQMLDAFADASSQRQSQRRRGRLDAGSELKIPVEVAS
jgi:spore maturation protein CgeB